ncbi:delta-like protein 4 isoform X2 [Daphnia pulicaria]|uniref:delta-like protein 4 isoform X2 n=1 Tax=Daphnia pulicaria TaxID=35523 RepID=UPI001EEBA649|nr:delta-like protein 4 isoform X2 [Daphnia pulicaria]
MAIRRMTVYTCSGSGKLKEGKGMRKPRRHVFNLFYLPCSSLGHIICWRVVIVSGLCGIISHRDKVLLLEDFLIDHLILLLYSSKNHVSMESSLLLRMIWIALVLGIEFSSSAEGAKLRKPTPISTSWQRQACESKEGKAGHFTCTPDGQLECFEGWIGDLCNVPICKKGCDPLNGHCRVPGECRCRIGFAGEHCRDCALLPGCVHGTCNKSFECVCKPGWNGLFCSQATCKESCHKSRGFCEKPGECRCRTGWAGEFCNECQTLPGCHNGFCRINPLDCICYPGWTGLLCQTPICKKGCSADHGYCEVPNQCRCRVGWWGSNCDVCHPYPGCRNGYCLKPWECRCQPHWTGFLCDQKIVSCARDSCLNGGTCLMLEPELNNKVAGEQGNITCLCPAAYTGLRCEVELKFQDERKWISHRSNHTSVHLTPSMAALFNMYGRI